MVIREKKVGERVKYWVRPDVVNRIEEGSINAYYESSIVEIKKHKVIIQTPEGIKTITNDWVIAATGYQPNLSFLEKMGIALSNNDVRKPDYYEETHETNMPNIYLAGVICCGMNTSRLSIENSREHAVRIIDSIRKK